MRGEENQRPGGEGGNEIKDRSTLYTPGDKFTNSFIFFRSALLVTRERADKTTKILIYIISLATHFHLSSFCCYSAIALPAHKGPPYLMSMSKQVADDRMALVTSPSSNSMGEMEFGGNAHRSSRLPPGW